MKTKLENGQKLSRQFRTAHLTLRAPDGTGNGADMDAKENIIRGVSVSSDEPYERFYGTEILTHTPDAIDLTRVTSGASPLLFNHDRDAHLGKVMNPQLLGGKLYVDLKFSSSDDAQQKLADLRDGILTECSIGYDVDRFEVDEEEETYTATRWTLYECSLVTIPADYSVGVGRAEQEEGHEVQICISEKKDSQNENSVDKNAKESQKRESQTHTMPETPAPAAVTETPEQRAAREKIEAQERSAKIREGMKAVREREKEIRAIAERATTCPKSEVEKALDAALNDEDAVENFRKLVFEKYWGDAGVVVTPGENDSRSTSKGGGAQQQRLSVGGDFVRSEQFKHASAHRGQGERNAAMEFKDVTMLGARGKVSLASRAGFSSADLASVNIQVLPGMVELGMQRLTIMDLLTGGTTNAAALPYAKENSFGTLNGTAFAAGTYPRAQTVGEGGQKPTWDADLTTDTANVKKVAVLTHVPDEFMADFAGMQSYIDGRLPYMVDLETEFQLLYGDGTGNNLKGILSNSGIQTRAIDTSTDTTVASSLKKGLTDISVNAQFEPSGYGFHPFDWETASLLKDSAGRFLAGGPYYIPYGNGVYVEMNTFWGKPVVVSTSVTYGRPVAGAWKLGAQYFIREGMRLETTNSNKDDFERNLVTIRAEHRLALATYRPVSFLEFTGFPART